MLVDTSIWIDHLRGDEDGLAVLLEADEVETHPFVIGELACGPIAGRDEVLGLLKQLRSIAAVHHAEALSFLDRHRLYRRGLSWVDIHLLASATLTSSQLWTRDKALGLAARYVGLRTFAR